MLSPLLFVLATLPLSLQEARLLLALPLDPLNIAERDLVFLLLLGKPYSLFQS